MLSGLRVHPVSAPTEIYFHNAVICTQNRVEVLEVGYLRKPGLLLHNRQAKN